MASMDNNGSSFPPQSNPVAYESDVEAELEVDQLDSDSDIEDPTKTSASKNGTGKAGERAPGHTLLPAVRLENMIQADGVTGNLALSKEGMFVLSVATEFIKRLIQSGHREASAHRRSMINYHDMAATTQQYQEFMFLSDTIPAPVSLADALMLRQAKEREILEDNPAMAPPFHIPSSAATPDAGISTSDAPKSKRSRTANGKEKVNGLGNTTSNKRASSSKRPTTSGHQLQDMNPRFTNESTEWAEGLEMGGQPEPIPNHNHRRSARNGISSASTSSSFPLPIANGHSGHSQSPTPPYTREGSEPDTMESQHPEPHSHSHTPSFPGQEDSAWPGQFTGPASGFLRGSTTPFGRVTQNPGRTIYSQNQHSD
ncbi:hypothetical protein B0H34DRAFT_448808 [Crassisporium funariophilum]|nr:hypothetical protein B0H34DRAFT_448808 [Crassisporium funariophilum]